MILRPEQIKLLALGLPATPANRSGGSSSSSTATNTTTNVTDRRFVNDGGGAGVSGDNNVTNSSTTNVTTDLGAIAGALDLAKTGIQTTSNDMNAAIGLAGQTFNKVVDTNKSMFDTNAADMLDGFKALLDQSNTVMQTAQQVNKTATSAVADAYQSAQTIADGQKFLVAGGLVIAGIVAVASMKGKL